LIAFCCCPTVVWKSKVPPSDVIKLCGRDIPNIAYNAT
jgi:hypothetical protein